MIKLNKALYFIFAFFIFISFAIGQVNVSGSKSVIPTIEIHSDIKQEINQLTNSKKPNSPLKKIKLNHEDSTLGRLENYYESMENGLQGFAQISSTPRSSVLQRQITIAGLLMLAGVMEVSSETNIPIYIPGARFYSFSSTKNEYQFNSQTIKLKGDIQKIINPEAGQRFEYEYTIETINKERKTNNEIKASCLVGKNSDANTLNLTLRGQYVSLECEEERNGQKSIREYVYLIESGVYIIKRISSGLNKGAYSIAEVEYAETK